MRKNDVFVVGSFVMGLTIRVPRSPVPGETLMGTGFDLGPGGKGLNLAIAAVRAGASVSQILCIGQDLFGEKAMQIIKQENLSAQYVHQVKGIHTGCGFVTLLPSGENTIVLDAGANQWMAPDLVRDAEAAIADSRVVVAQLEVPNDAVETALQLGRRHGCLTMLNPAPARRLPDGLLQYVDILTPNETEARLLLGLPPDDGTPTEDLAQQLLALGPGAVVVTRGKLGALLVTANQVESIPAPSIQTVDPTGAGDCFNGLVASQLARGKSLIDAVRRAVHGGAYCAGKLGVINGLPTTSELDEFINQHRL
ncbi:ribokinase [Rudanella paleaurantiibacter]|uniref:Ribokinase n=1 Tax=Rudanella paleaurantiibacter TaxID=2614655 RepID=A0A7J5TT41_9BACT|nr:ribokinase [Rudanella paleaurantiibacter]KAB7726699.1 ribokinase [Rudanella paleaurantiibacter]